MVKIDYFNLFYAGKWGKNVEKEDTTILRKNRNESEEGGFLLGRRVLIVDDAAFMRMMIRNILVSGGYEVVGNAENGVEAVELYERLKPDLVTMDITMPEKDGITAVKEIIALDSEAKIVMCSAMGQQALVIEAIQSGAKDFIVKPFRPDRVLEAINKVMANSFTRRD